MSSYTASIVFGLTAKHSSSSSVYRSAQLHRPLPIGALENKENVTELIRLHEVRKAKGKAEDKSLIWNSHWRRKSLKISIFFTNVL
ncbi:hypothetical protein UPYG_G00261430 [Umbra pygmaea]|uniref:Uncharacterized protein n=1 Tax=Umbra pygmaea TaxID=75934 RepID=A0ABD0WR52_UMBPY